MEIDHIEDAGAESTDAGALESEESQGHEPEDSWPYEPTPLPEPKQEAETTDDDDTELDDAADPVTTETVETTPPGEQPHQQPTRAERIRQRAIEEYRKSPEYAAEVEQQAEARRAADRLEAEQAAARAEAERRLTETQAETDKRLGKYLGKVKTEDGKTEYERDLAYIESKREEIEAGDEDYVDPDVKREIREAKARIAKVNENRQMATVINDLAWKGIATDYMAALSFPELASLDEATKTAIARPNTLAEGLSLIRQHLLAGATRTHQQTVAQLQATHANEVKALKADLDGWKARAAGGGGTPETGGHGATRGGLTLERYQRMTAEEQADLSPADIDRMTADIAAQRQIQQRR